MYYFPDEINYKALFPFHKTMIRNGVWAMMPSSAKSIFPVIASYANKNGLAFPSERTISILCGRTDKTVREGIRHLGKLDCISVQPYITEHVRRSKRFHIKSPIPERGKTFPFYRSVLESGFWQELKPAAQALYPVMRSYGYFDEDAYREEWAPEDADDMEFDELYQNRLLDFVEAERRILVEKAGINYRSLEAAVVNLVNNCLVRFYEEDRGLQRYLVFLHPFSGCADSPERYVTRASLHKKIRARYKSELKPTTCNEV